MIYFIGSSTRSMIKIGASNSPARRLGELQEGNPEQLRILATMPICAERGFTEKAIHALFAEHRETGEWFRSCFELRELIRLIGQHAWERGPAAHLDAIGWQGEPMPESITQPTSSDSLTLIGRLQKIQEAYGRSDVAMAEALGLRTEDWQAVLRYEQILGSYSLGMILRTMGLDKCVIEYLKALEPLPFYRMRP